MANINTELEQIRKAIYGREVRGSIANAIELINKEQINTNTAQTNLDNKFNQLIINAGNSNAEVVASRVKADGTQFDTLGKRLDKGDELHNTLNNEVIGARTDSKNVVHKNLKARLDSFDSELDSKVSCFETVASMKRSNKLEINSICKTLGYYTVADGGGATYRITNNVASENGFSFSLTNGLTAELIFTDEINIKQLGARDYDEKGDKVDIKPFIELYISKTNPINNLSNKKIIKLIIPPGRWFTSPMKIKSSSIYIEGVNNYSYPYATGTILLPLKNNQSNLWIVGDDTTDNLGLEYCNITLKSLMFSTHNSAQSDGIYVGGLTAGKCFSCQKLLHISRVYGGVFENIHFTNYVGTALTINSSNELIFNNFSFRNGDSFETGNVVFDTDVTGSKNISACFFDKFSFEGVKGDIFNFKKDSKFINNKIGTIIFEDREVKVSKDGTFRNYTIANDSKKTFISKSIINIEEQEYCEINVDNILINNLGKVVFILDGKEYLFDTIVKENGKVAKGHINIKNISHIGARRDTMLLNKNEYEGLGSYNFKFVCENANHIDSDAYSFVINTPGSMKPRIRYKDILYKRCIDYVSSPNVVLNKNDKAGYFMPVVTDNDSILSEKLVVNNLNYKKYVSSFSAEASCFVIPVLGNKLHIRVKTKAGFLAHCYLVESTGQKDYTVTSKGETYNWYTIDFTSYRQAHTDKEMLVALRTLTADEANYVKLDVFYWE